MAGIDPGHSPAGPGGREAQKSSIAIGTASLGLTHLPVIIADRKAYFKEEGLSVEINAFSGGSKALEALLGGSLNMVSGAYSNTLTMAARNMKLVEFVEQIRCPGFAVLVSKRKMAAYHGPKDMKGWNIGVSMAAGAVAAMRAGQIDAVINSDPVNTILIQDGDATNVVDMRAPETSDAVFGGPYPEASVYTTAAFAKKNPRTIQAATNAVARAERWMAQAMPDQIADALPEEYLLGNRATYIAALGAMRSCYSPDGLMSKQAAETVLKILSAFDENVRNAEIDLGTTYDNSYVNRVPRVKVGLLRWQAQTVQTGTLKTPAVAAQVARA